jgi:hypothetical protein
MKLFQVVFLSMVIDTEFVRSEDVAIADSSGSTAAAPIQPTTARIIGDIPDGTPPPPTPPKPDFVVPAQDILSTTTHEQGGRTITIQRIKAIPLPPPPAPAPSSQAGDDSDFRARLAAYRAEHPQSKTVSLGATVYRSKDSPARSLVTYRPGAEMEPVTFWSSADFSLLAGIRNFADTTGQVRTMFLMWSAVDIDRMTASLKQHGREYNVPAIPEFAEGKATFAIVGNPPAAEALVPIQSLHDVYNNEYLRLKAAYEGRERARIEREAYLKANPPQPKDITLKYWRTEKPAPATGGAR